jgi:hypothetical protein
VQIVDANSRLASVRTICGLIGEKIFRKLVLGPRRGVTILTPDRGSTAQQAVAAGGQSRTEQHVLVT